MSQEKNYCIVAVPELRVAETGRKMSFYLQRLNDEVPDPKLPSYKGGPRITWFCLNELTEHTDRFWRSHRYSGPRDTPEWKNASWSFEGSHRIVCVVSYQGKEESYEYIQRVVPQNQITAYVRDSAEVTGNPYASLSLLNKQNNLIVTLEEGLQLSKEDQEDYEKRKEQREKQFERMQWLLSHIPEAYRPHFRTMRALHFSYVYESSNSMPLLICFFSNGGNTVYLLDWTTPMEKGKCGVYEGKGNDEKEAMKDAIRKWDNQNTYPKGVMKYSYTLSELPVETISETEYLANATEEEKARLEQDRQNHPDDVQKFLKEWTIWGFKGEFETDGESDAGTVSKWLSYVALTAAVIAGVITLVAPIPGSRVVSGLIWTSILTSTGSAMINIADRRMNGFYDVKEDAIDALTIASNVISAGTMGAAARWARTGLMLGNAQRTGLKFALIGQIGADSIQGVLVASVYADAVYTVINDRKIPADHKLDRIVGLMTRAAIDGLMVYINVRGNNSGLKSINEISTTPHNTVSRQEIDDLIQHGLSPQEKARYAAEINAAPAHGAEANLPAPSHTGDVQPSSAPPRSGQEPSSRNPATGSADNTVHVDRDELNNALRREQMAITAGAEASPVQVDRRLVELVQTEIEHPGFRLEAELQQNLTAGQNRQLEAVTASAGEHSGSSSGSAGGGGSSSGSGSTPGSRPPRTGGSEGTPPPGDRLPQDGGGITGSDKPQGNTSGKEVELDYHTQRDNTTNPEVRTRVITGHNKVRSPQEIMESLRIQYQKWAGMKPHLGRLKSRAALAHTRWIVGDKVIASQADFHNIEGMSLPKLEQDGFIKIDTERKIFHIVDTDAYMRNLADSYRGLADAYPNVRTTMMHTEMDIMIRRFISESGNEFSVFNRAPGAHAEVLSTNNIFHQLTENGISISSALPNIEVYVLKLGPDSSLGQQGGPFPACTNCSGILKHPINIVTGRIGGN